MEERKQFETFLKKEGLAENTIRSYLWTVDFFQMHYGDINRENLMAYKGYLVEYFKPKTANCTFRINGAPFPHQRCKRLAPTVRYPFSY